MVEYETVQVSKVASSSNHQDTKAENVLDGNIETKWSAKNEVGKDPQFLTIDVGESKLISGIAVKFYEADIRRQQYTLYFSDKGGDEVENWRRIGTAVSSGTANNEYEENVFERPINARYFKLVGEGNSLNSMTSIIDIKLLGARKPEEKQVLLAGDIQTPETIVVGDNPTAREKVTASGVAGDDTKGASVKANTVNDTNSDPNASSKKVGK